MDQVHTSELTGAFITLKLTTLQPGTKRRGKSIYVSGLITGLSATTISLDVEHYDAWRCTTSHRVVSLDRGRILYASRDLS